MFQRLRKRMGAKAGVLAVALVLVGGSIALALPDEAIDGQAKAAENHAAALEKAAAAQENGENGEENGPPEDVETGMPDEVRTFLDELFVWVGCIQEGARAHGEQQSNPDTRVEDAEYDAAAKLALCGEKPENPNDEGEEAEAEAEGDGPPEFAGRPDWAGPPPHAGDDE